MRSPALLAYRVLMWALTPFAGRLLAWRAAFGKEDAERLGERMGLASARRPAGALAWLHGASIGETLGLLPLVEALTASGVGVLATTGTASSARVVAGRLPAGAVHQFFPLDCPRFVARFLDHWRPDIAVFAESEAWPNMIAAARRRGMQVALANARMSPRSFERWRMLGGAAQEVFGAFAPVLAQSQDEAARFLRLGARDVMVVGNLKYDAAPPPAPPDALAALVAQVGPRPVWVAASTHPGEEDDCLAAHRRLAGRAPDLLTIIVPRDARRGAEIAALAHSCGLRSARRGAGGRPDADVQVYVADTFGEMGLWFRLTDIVFMGKSLTPGGGGQNPIEPAKLGAAVLHGPSIGNFGDVYAALDAAGGGLCVADGKGLADALETLLADGAHARAIARAAARTIEAHAGAADKSMRALAPLLAQARAGAGR